jgi:hypothetical protein
MRLRVDFRGALDGNDVYTSVYVVLQKGEFDSHLMFPYTGQVRITLIPQLSSRGNHHHNNNRQQISSVISCKEVPRNTTGNINSRINSRGRLRFAKHKDIMTMPFLKNNALFFDIVVLGSTDALGSSSVDNAV